MVFKSFLQDLYHCIRVIVLNQVDINEQLTIFLIKCVGSEIVNSYPKASNARIFGDFKTTGIDLVII